MRLLEFDDFEKEHEEREKQLEEPEVADKGQKYIYTVHEDDEETGAFRADVRHVDGSIVFELKEKNFPTTDDDVKKFDEAQEQEGAEPAMRDVNDIKGLRGILLKKGIMKEEDTLTSNEDYAKGAAADDPVAPINVNLSHLQRENKNMKLHNFEGFLNENINEAETGNKFVLVRFGTTPDPRVTAYFREISRRAALAKLPGAFMTVFECSLTKEALIEGFDRLAINYELYQIVHKSSGGGSGNAMSNAAPNLGAMSIDELKKKMKDLIDKEKYEEATEYRDEILRREGHPVGRADGRIGDEMPENEETIGSAIWALESVRSFPEIHKQLKEALVKRLTDGIKLTD